MRQMMLTGLATALAGVAAAQPGPAPILAANRAAMHGERLPASASLEAVYAYAGEGMTGEATTRFDLSTGAFVDSAAIGPFDQANGFDGKTAWARDMSGAVTPEAGGDVRELAVNEAYRDANAWWRPDFGGARIVSLGRKNEGARAFDVLEVKPRGGKTFEAWFDAATHLLGRTVEPQSFQTITTDYDAFAPVGGVAGGFLVPGKIAIDDGTGPQYAQHETITRAAFLPLAPAAGYGPPPWRDAEATIANASGVTTVPFLLRNNHIYAEVKVNGKGPFLCIFDTGGHDILTPETARAIAVASQGQAPGTGAGEGVVDIGFAKDVTFQIGDLVMHDRGIAVLPFEQGGVEGFDEQGMIGFEVFRRFVTRIDYGAHTLTFIDPAKFDPRGAGTPIRFVFYQHLPQVEGRFEGVTGRFDIDTGSRSEIDITKPTVDADGLIAAHPKGLVLTDGWGVGGPSRSYVSRAGPLVIGPIRVDHLIAGFATQPKGAFADPNYVGNIGSGLLKRFVVTFDYAHQVMYLKPLPAPVPDTDVFDRSGMWINATPAGFKIVDLSPGGAAEAAGLAKGDTITAVDGKPSADVKLWELRRRLRDEPVGTQVRLEVTDAKGASRAATLLLKDQI